MKRLSVCFISLLIALHTNATEPSFLQMANSQPQKSHITPTQDNQRVRQPHTSVYIVQLSEPAVARYTGGIAAMDATSPQVTGAHSLDVNTPPSKTYARYLKNKQEHIHSLSEQITGQPLKVKFSYQHAFNGVAIEMSAGQAKLIEALPDVVRVTKDTYETLLTDIGPQWINAPAIWQAPAPLPASKGEGIVVAVLDTGINHDHPSFADIGGDGYDHINPLGSGNYLPGSYCDTKDPAFCNDKLIGAWGFVTGNADPHSPHDSNGHGSHTASTVAGNVITAAIVNAPTTHITRSISGIAPHANIIMYDVCTEGCPTSAILAALEQVLKDASVLPNGIHALNFSISGGEDPYNSPVELAFLNATAAGIFVSASAGNSGPGAETVAHNSPWLSTVAATTHSRELLNTLIDLNSNGTTLDNISGLGFTAAYGPAAIVHANRFPTNNGSSNDNNPGQCLEPFPAGHFNGQIVVCDRGKIARISKGANVLAGGAGGFVLANMKVHGESIVGDAHVLPGLHIGFKEGERLRKWLASQPAASATIGGVSINIDTHKADIMAGFSSRGPSLSMDVLKPDIAAPGVNILAAINSNDGSDTGPEYGFISGTSMSSPHNAGAAALISAARPHWSPYAIQSAMMMTARTSRLFKEDGFTPANAFDVGAGRLDLGQILKAGLILDETPENFRAANPALGGDPKTLNIASMKNSACVQYCSWTRTLTNATELPTNWTLHTDNVNGLKLSVQPSNIELAPGQSQQITVTANTTLAPAGWHFSQLTLKHQGDSPDLHMPVVVLPANSSRASVLNKTVDKIQAEEDDILTYRIDITNNPYSQAISLNDTLPDALELIEDSITYTVTSGIDVSAPTVDDNTLNWHATMRQNRLQLQAAASPYGYVPLSQFTKPYGCPDDSCDDGGVVLKVPDFVYNGETYNEVIWSVNGTLQAGTDREKRSGFRGKNMPQPIPPNNLMAPLWTDLDMGTDGDGAEWYTAVLKHGDESYTVYEWNNIPQANDNSTRYTFQIWVQNGASGNIWFVYEQLDGRDPLSNVSIGVEDKTGMIGDSYFFNGKGTAPEPGTSLKVVHTPGGSATITFKARIDECEDNDTIVNRVNLTSTLSTATAIAVTQCL